MQINIPICRALLSVSNKDGLPAFARGLVAHGVEIISTGGTARALADEGISVTSIEELTGFPEMLDGRVKTLHPLVHGSLLGRRDNPAHVAAMQEHGMEPIDLVCINLYPFEQTVSGDVTEEEGIEQIDIGGPAMLRSAAKNHAFVTTVSSPTQYEEVLACLDAHKGASTPALRRRLAVDVFEQTSGYDATITRWLRSRDPSAGRGIFPPRLQLEYQHQADLRYGENPHQEAALYRGPDPSEVNVVSAEILHGKPLSYNNILDASAALELVKELHARSPKNASAAIIKHTNPCGAATMTTTEEAFAMALAGDPRAAYGGILALDRTLDRETAEQIAAGETFLEVILAPGFDPDALEILGNRWRTIRLLAIGQLGTEPRQRMTGRQIPGGYLAQVDDTMSSDPSNWTHAAGPAPGIDMMETAALAWTVARHLSSNAIAIAGPRGLLGAGSGQVDRVGACRIAVEKAGSRIVDDGPAVAASDAFFPFQDGPALLMEAGVQCIVHPGGSRRDEETFDLCSAGNVTCLLTGFRHFRH